MIAFQSPIESRLAKVDWKVGGRRETEIAVEFAIRFLWRRGVEPTLVRLVARRDKPETRSETRTELDTSKAGLPDVPYPEWRQAAGKVERYSSREHATYKVTCTGGARCYCSNHSSILFSASGGGQGPNGSDSCAISCLYTVFHMPCVP